MGAILCPVVSRAPAGAVRFANTHLSDDETVAKIGHPGLESDMREAAKNSSSKKAPQLRDTIKELRTKEFLFR
jgi:hypothetical protein